MLWKNDIYKGEKLDIRGIVMSIIKNKNKLIYGSKTLWSRLLKSVMSFVENKNKLSVELTDIEVDVSEMINIKEAKVVYVNGAGKLVNNRSEYGCSMNIRLNDIPLVQVNLPSSSTTSSILASGYGIENADCEELKKIQKEINSNFISLEESIKTIEPLLKLFETGFYLIADAECYPTDGEKNFYWDISNKLKDYPATALVFSHEYGDNYYVFGQPVYLYPTQTTDCYNKERVDYYIEKFKNSDNDEPRAIVYNFGEFINFVIDGHHKACASALLGKPLKCLLIIKGEIYRDYYKKNYLKFLGREIEGDKISDKYRKLAKFERNNPAESVSIKEGCVNKREWEEEYIESVKKFPDLIKYATIVNDLVYEKMEITDDLMEYYLKKFDRESQRKVRIIIHNLEFSDKKKAQEFIIKYARASLKHKISNKLKILMYEFLAKIKDNPEIEQVFIDYIVQNEDINDPILKIIDSYWEK